MISKSDIHVRLVEYPVGMPRFHSAIVANLLLELRIGCEDDPWHVNEAKQRAAIELWRHVYGDLDTDLNLAVHQVHLIASRIGPYSFADHKNIEELFRPILEKLR